ncbi:B3 domain-containing protein Os03g0620400-like isoform X2 [Tripterygium wilfordii]|uniref:B3 domain-containing protein Os03g0620400-like isoform X2 n=1 Tax=Tripterygium wilfordii TaxID=458696 RepID=UPI0018F81D13|nr:B3 domain-containing protein Os03g0620400-like isoform X2 [Tripterygium wilfordii]
MVNVSEPCFFAFFSYPSTAERLKIPEKFIKHINDGTTGPIVLMGPSGNSWHVDLIQQDDGLFLHQGWPEFARDNFLECGDLLVFRYNGQLHFIVEVFDQSACKKEFVFNSEYRQQEPCEFDKNARKKREREADGVSSTGIFEGVPKRLRDSSDVFHSKCRDMDANAHLSDKEGCGHEEVITTETFREESYSRETNQYGSLVKIYSTPPQSKACNGKPEAGVKKRTGREENLDMHERCYLSTLPEHEEKRVAQSFTSSFPFFVRIMKRFNISGSYTLNIPYKFSMAHLPTCKAEIVLRNLKGACWTVNSVPTTRVHTSHTLCGGWLSFVRDNDIKMGDICVFELVHKSEFCVHILRVGKEKPETQSEKQALHGVNVGCAATLYKTSDGLLNKVKKTPSKFHAKCLKKVASCEKNGSNKSQESSSPNHTRKHGSATKKSVEKAIRRGNSMETELGSQAGGGSRIMMARDEEKAAKTFVSGFPHFVRIMRKFNVSGSYTLKIPHKFSAAHLPNCKSEIVIRNSKGRNWTVNSVPDSKGRMVHTFCGGWMAFVRDNDLKEGDVCIFELVNTCEMHVHISGVETILLDLQCGNT